MTAAHEDAGLARSLIDECQILVGLIGSGSPDGCRQRLFTLARRWRSLSPGPQAVIAAYAIMQVACRADPAGPMRGWSEQLVTAILSGRDTRSNGPSEACPPILGAALTLIDRMSHDSDCRLSSVAAKLRVSRWYLDRVLKRYTGRTFTEHLRSSRVNRARELLERTDLSVKEIAAAVGYRQASALDHAFGRLVQLSPTEYRRQSRCAASETIEPTPSDRSNGVARVARE
jgi:AraC-like DNA-binding protein